jgi:hypothetical protein
MLKCSKGSLSANEDDCQVPSCSYYASSESIGSFYEFSSEQLGAGQFGVVHSVVSRSTGELLACKSILKQFLAVSQLCHVV